MELLSREEELRKLYRYGAYESPVFYKANLWIHTHRVTWMIQEICEFINSAFQKNIDKDYLIALAHVHDDTEIITGDFIGPIKDTWDNKTKEKYESDCLQAIPILVKKYGDSFMGYSYSELLEYEQEEKDELFYYILKYADKLDGQMEVTHELLAGNFEFKDEIKNKFHRDAFIYNYNRAFELLEKISKKLNVDIHELYNFGLCNLSNILRSEYFLESSTGLYTLKTLKRNTKYQPYNSWIDLHFKYGDDEQIKYLYTQIES